jgi:spore maturation protein CgeB
VHIGLIGPHDPDMSQDNIGQSLTRMGHRVTYLGATTVRRGNHVVRRLRNLAMAGLPELEDRFQGRLVRRALDRECDAVLTVDGNLSPHAVAALRHHGLPVALWFPDAVSNLGRQRMIANSYSALFFKEPLLVRRLRDMLGLPVWYLPQACNPMFHRPIGEAATERWIVVVGNSYPTRTVLLRRLHEAGIPLRIYGASLPRWDHGLLPPSLYAGRAVFREDKSRVFRSAAGVLNNLHPAEIQGVNLRLFEATAAGGAVLCERRAALSDLYDLDREVIAFGDFDELVDGCRALLADTQLTKDIGDAASKRAHAEHTYEMRLNTILDKLA